MVARDKQRKHDERSTLTPAPWRIFDQEGRGGFGLLRRLLTVEMVIIYTVLVSGAIVFSFPFLWMVATSLKVDREMAAEKIRLLPTAPRPQHRSPYIDTGEFDVPDTPDGIPEAVWRLALPRLEEQLLRLIDRWKPRTVSAVEPADPSTLDQAVYRREMMEGLLGVAAERIRDDVRRAAVEAERQQRLAKGSDPTSLHDRYLAHNLSVEAIEVGIQAILADTGSLLDEQILHHTFDRCYRRFCLGACRIRTVDYKMHSLSSGCEWSVEKGPAELSQRRELGEAFQEVRLRFGPKQSSVRFSLTKPLPVPAADVDRIYVSYRGDATWARLVFEVIRQGQRYRTDEVVNLFDRDWIETQLRWPQGAGDATERRTYFFLRHAGPAPAHSPPFAVRLLVQKNSYLGAWKDKILNQYRTVFRELPFRRYIMTSFALSILSIVLMVYSCSLTAYAFARLQWPGRDVCFVLLLATMMIPPQVTMIPSFLIFKHLGWYNTLRPLWVTAAFGTPFFIFLLRQFLKTIPQDLEDAARIDGCGFGRIYWHVMLPLVRPTIAIIAIYTFIGTWNNFMGPLIFVNDERLFPLAMGLFKFSLRSGSDVGLMMAASFVMTLPVIALFFCVQRHFIQGITLTGMKA